MAREIERINADGISYHLYKTTDDQIYEVKLRFDTKNQSLAGLGKVYGLVKKLQEQGKHNIAISANHNHESNQIILRYDTTKQYGMKGTRERKSAKAVESLLYLLEEIECSREFPMPEVSQFKNCLTDLVDMYEEKGSMVEDALRRRDELEKEEYQNDFNAIPPETNWSITRKSKEWEDFQRKLDPGLEEMASCFMTEEDFTKALEDIEIHLDNIGGNSIYLGNMFDWGTTYGQYMDKREEAKKAGDIMEAKRQQVHLGVLGFQMEEQTTIGKKYAEENWEVKYPTDERTGRECIKRLKEHNEETVEEPLEIGKSILFRLGKEKAVQLDEYVGKNGYILRLRTRLKGGVPKGKEVVNLKHKELFSQTPKKIEGLRERGLDSLMHQLEEIKFPTKYEVAVKRRLKALHRADDDYENEAGQFQ